MLGINHQRGTHHSAPLQNYRRARFDDTVSEQQTVNYTNDRSPKEFVFQGIGNIEGVYFWRSATDRKWYFEDPLDNDAITCVGSRQNLQNALKERQFWWLETDKSYEDVTVTRHPDGSKSYDYEGLTDPAEITAQIDRENEEANKNSAEPSKWKGLALAAMTLIAGMPGAQTLVKNTISAPEPAQPEPQPNSTAAALRFLNNASSAPSEPAGNPNTAPESFFDYDYYSNLGFRGLQLTSGMLAAAATVKSGVVAAPLVLMAMLMNTKVVEGGIVKSHKRPAPSSVEEELAKPVTTTNSFTIPTVTSTTLPAATPKSVYGPEAVFGPNSNVGILTKRSHHHKPTTAVPVSKRIVQRPTASSNVTNQTAVPHIPMVHLPNNQTVQSSAQTNLTKPGTAKPSVLPQNTTTNVTHTAAALKQNQVAHPQPVQKTVAQVALSNQLPSPSLTPIPSPSPTPTTTPIPTPDDSNSDSNALEIIGLAVGGAAILGVLTFAYYKGFFGYVYNLLNDYRTVAVDESGEKSIEMTEPQVSSRISETQQNISALPGNARVRRRANKKRNVSQSNSSGNGYSQVMNQPEDNVLLNISINGLSTAIDSGQFKKHNSYHVSTIRFTEGDAVKARVKILINDKIASVVSVSGANELLIEGAELNVLLKKLEDGKQKLEVISHIIDELSQDNPNNSAWEMTSERNAVGKAKKDLNAQTTAVNLMIAKKLVDDDTTVANVQKAYDSFRTPVGTDVKDRLPFLYEQFLTEINHKFELIDGTQIGESNSCSTNELRRMANEFLVERGDFDTIGNKGNINILVELKKYYYLRKIVQMLNAYDTDQSHPCLDPYEIRNGLVHNGFSAKEQKLKRFLIDLRFAFQLMVNDNVGNMEKLLKRTDLCKEENGLIVCVPRRQRGETVTTDMLNIFLENGRGRSGTSRLEGYWTLFRDVCELNVPENFQNYVEESLRQIYIMIWECLAFIRDYPNFNNIRQVSDTILNSLRNIKSRLDAWGIFDTATRGSQPESRNEIAHAIDASDQIDFARLCNFFTSKEKKQKDNEFKVFANDIKSYNS